MSTAPQRPLTIDVHRGGDAVVVKLGGAATIDQADRLTYELRQIAGEPFARMVIDLSDLEFICSMGLGALIVAHVVKQRNQGQVLLAGAQAAIREILQTTRLDMIFPVRADVKSALN